MSPTWQCMEETMTRDKKSAVGNERWSSYAMDESGGALSDMDDYYSPDSGRTEELACGRS